MLCSGSQYRVLIPYVNTPCIHAPYTSHLTLYIHTDALHYNQQIILNNTNRYTKHTTSKVMQNICETHYSPFIRCGGVACGSHNGNKLCLGHLICAKQQEECSICFNKLTERSAILLTCGHMFHCDCMSSCRTPQCPLCRKQLEPAEAVATVGKMYVDKLATELYSLPVDKIKTAIECIKIIMKICAFAPKQMYELLKILIV